MQSSQFSSEFIFQHLLKVVSFLVTERLRTWIVRRVAGLSLRDGIRSSDIRRERRVEQLLLHVQRSQKVVWASD